MPPWIRSEKRRGGPALDPATGDRREQGGRVRWRGDGGRRARGGGAAAVGGRGALVAWATRESRLGCSGGVTDWGVGWVVRLVGSGSLG